MHRPKRRRCREEHHVHAAVDDLLVGIESGETTLVRHLVLGGEGRVFGSAPGQVGLAGRQAIGEEISERDELDAVGRKEAVPRRASATTAASNESDANYLGVAGGKRAERAGQNHTRRGYGASPYEASTCRHGNSRTSRKPTKGPSDNHQRLFGI